VFDLPDDVVGGALFVSVGVDEHSRIDFMHAIKRADAHGRSSFRLGDYGAETSFDCSPEIG
jgi:hypothetical protein